MAKAKAQQVVGTLTFVAKESLVITEGVFVDQGENQIVIDVKRPRSSKYDRKVFATADLLQMYVTGETVIIAQRGAYEEVYANVTVSEITENGAISVVDEDGNQIVCAAGTWVFVADEAEEEAPKAKGKKAPAKKAPAKKVEDDEEDEDDSEEESDDEAEEAEEEAPKAKGKKAPAKKAAAKPAAKGKGKKAVEEDEEEEESDDDEDDDDWE